MASVNDIVSTNSGAWHNTFVYKVKSITNDVVLLHLANASTFAFHSGDHAIQYDQSTGTWSDVNTSTDPFYFTTTNTFVANTSLSNYPTNIFCWDNSQSIIRLELIAPTWALQPVPLGGGTGTSTEGVAPRRS